MKKKKFEKKLTISKTTVANLSEEKLDALRGGITGRLTCGGCTMPLTGCPYTDCGDSWLIPCYC